MLSKSEIAPSRMAAPCNCRAVSAISTRLHHRVVKAQSDNIPRFENLSLGRLHGFDEPLGVGADEAAGCLHNAAAGPEILLEIDALHIGVATLEVEDVVDVTTAPLVDGLIVVTDHAQTGAEVVQRTDDALLHRIEVLVLVHDDVAQSLGQAGADRLNLAQRHGGDFKDTGIVEIGMVMAQLAVGFQTLQNRAAGQLLRHQRALPAPKAWPQATQEISQCLPPLLFSRQGGVLVFLDQG